MAELKEGLQIARELVWLPKVPHPLRGDRSQFTIEQFAQLGYNVRQRIGKVLVFPLTETIAGHLNATAEQIVIVVPAGDGVATGRIQQPAERSEARSIKSIPNLRPRDIPNVLSNGHSDDHIQHDPPVLSDSCSGIVHRDSGSLLAEHESAWHSRSERVQRG